MTSQIRISFFKFLPMKGFAVKSVDWVNLVVNDGSVAVMINDQMGSYFKTLRVVIRKGGSHVPCSFLFGCRCSGCSD
jgi:hypothetical protein